MNIPKCSLCKTAYDVLQHRPLTLPDCSHTFCFECLDRLQKTTPNNKLSCPVDQTVTSTAVSSRNHGRPTATKHLHSQNDLSWRSTLMSRTQPRIWVLLSTWPRNLKRRKSALYAVFSVSTKVTKSFKSESSRKWLGDWQPNSNSSATKQNTSKTSRKTKLSPISSKIKLQKTLPAHVEKWTFCTTLHN